MRQAQQGDAWARSIGMPTPGCCTLLGKAKRSRWMQLVTMVESRNAAVRAVLHAGGSIGRRHLLANTELRETRATTKPDRFLGRHWQLLLSVLALIGARLPKLTQAGRKPLRRGEATLLLVRGDDGWVCVESPL